MNLYLLTFVVFLKVTEAQYGDVRCKCVCPRDVLKRNVVIKFVSVHNCTCVNLIQLEESKCLRCRCDYEARNTVLIKVVVTFIVVVLVILIIYMIMLSILSLWKPRELSVRSDVLQERLIQRSNTLNRLDSTVTKWKESVENQRRNVYNHHTMLS
ncbi:transmembrane protein 9B-like [Xenia sp. Carnegie-2017]|uniref:transmembrane protein 9B-like n=1 Tax=Xenia sp. Carnegie-2017 TaxID=2897299 RepID=UPI001F04A5AD|nr:transmembrane protein 9B-like [Xenia sp. Carnegie-2017]